MLYGRALRRPKIRRKLLQAAAANTVRVISERVNRSAKFAQSLFPKRSLESGSGPKTNSAGETEAAEKGVRNAKKRKSELLKEVAKKRELAEAEPVGISKGTVAVNQDGKPTVAKRREVAETELVQTKAGTTAVDQGGKASDIVVTAARSATVDGKKSASTTALNGDSKSKLVGNLSGTTKSSIRPTVSQRTPQPRVNTSEEFDDLTIPVIPGHKEADDGRSLPRERIPTLKELQSLTITYKQKVGALRTLYKRVPFQLQSKLTEKYGIKFKNERQSRQSQLQQGNIMIPAHRLSFEPYIKDMTVYEKEALVRLFGEPKLTANGIKEVRKQASNLRPTKASLDIDILPGVKIENQTEPSIGWTDASLQTFAGKVVLDDDQMATIFSQEEAWLRPDALDRRVYYIDVAASNPGNRSAQGSRVGIATPQRLSSGAATHDKWELYPVHIRDKLPSREAETAALAFLLSWIQVKVNEEVASGIRSQNFTVAIFTRNRESLSQLAKKSPLDSRDRCQYLLLEKIVELVNHLAYNGVRTVLHYVPDQASVRGAQVARVLAHALPNEVSTSSAPEAASRQGNHATPKPERPLPAELVRAQERGESLLEQMKDMDEAQKTDLLERLKNALATPVSKYLQVADRYLHHDKSYRSISLLRDVHNAPVENDPFIANGESTGASANVEDIADQVFTRPRAEAMAFAFEEELLRGNEPGRDVYWTDASSRRGYSAMSSVIKRRNIDQRLSRIFRLETWKIDTGRTSAHTAELTALILTLKEAWKRRVAVIAGRQPSQTKTIVIFTDDQATLNEIQGSDPAAPEWTADYWLLQKLIEWIRRYNRVGIRVELHWVPGHAGVPGNELANQLAGMGAYHFFGDRSSFISAESNTILDLAASLPESSCESTPDELIQLAPAEKEMERILSNSFENLDVKQQRRLAGLFGFDPDLAQDGSQKRPYESLSHCMQSMKGRDRVVLARGLLQHVESSPDLLKEIGYAWDSGNKQLGYGRHALGILDAVKTHPQNNQKPSFTDLNLQGNISVRPWAESIAFALEYDVLTTESRSHHSCYIDLCFDGRKSPPTPCFAVADNIRTDGKRRFSHSDVIVFRHEVDPLEAQLVGIISVLADMLKIIAPRYKSRKGRVVTIFSNFRSALKLLQGGWKSLPSKKSLYPLAKEIADLVHELGTNGMEIHLEWMPGNINGPGSTATKFLFKELLNLDLDAVEKPAPGKLLSGQNLTPGQTRSMSDEAKKALLESFRQKDALDDGALSIIRGQAREARYFARSPDELLEHPNALLEEAEGGVLGDEGETFAPLTIDRQVFIRPEIDSAIFSFNASLHVTGNSRAYWTAVTPQRIEGSHCVAFSRRVRKTETSPELRWLAHGYYVRRTPTPLVAELSAIIILLRRFRKMLGLQRQTFVIFCQNKEILQYLAGQKPLPGTSRTTSTLFARIPQWIRHYASIGRPVELHWVPPGSPAAGCLIANTIASDAHRLLSATASLQRSSTKSSGRAPRKESLRSEGRQVKKVSNATQSPRRERQPRRKEGALTASPSEQVSESNKNTASPDTINAANGTATRTEPDTSSSSVEKATDASQPRRKKKTRPSRRQRKRAARLKAAETEAKAAEAKQQPSNDQAITSADLDKAADAGPSRVESRARKPVGRVRFAVSHRAKTELTGSEPKSPRRGESSDEAITSVDLDRAADAGPSRVEFIVRRIPR